MRTWYFRWGLIFLGGDSDAPGNYGHPLGRTGTHIWLNRAHWDLNLAHQGSLGLRFASPSSSELRFGSSGSLGHTGTQIWLIGAEQDSNLVPAISVISGNIGKYR